MNIKEVLRTEFENRCQRNGRYSLRAFSRFLDIDTPTLSRIFNDQKKVGPRLTNRLATKLGLEPSKTERLLRSAVVLKSMESPKNSEYKFIEDDQFNIISHWYYFAILEVLELDGAHHDPKWIASKLGLSLNVAKTAIKRLERTGIIMKQGEKWIDTTSGAMTVLGKELTSSARRQHQKEILEKAIEALEEVPVEFRDQTSMTMAISREEVPKVREFITEFRRKTSRYLLQSSKKDQVYNLSISFYPVTKQ